MLPIQHYFPKADALVYGCMGLGGSWDHPTTSKEQRELSFTAIDAALEADIRFFDHADIYGDYTTESDFGKAISNSKIARNTIQLISKCGIQHTRGSDNKIKHYDYAKNYIIWSVENSLKNLQTD